MQDVLRDKTNKLVLKSEGDREPLAGPKEIHALWYLMRRVGEIPCDPRRLSGGEIFEFASGKDILRLLKIGLSLGLLKKVGENAFVKTEEGTIFANADHWRCWKPNQNAVNKFGVEYASRLFIDKDKYKQRPIVVDLFAGVGGLSLGFESAGFNVKVAVDNDSEACEAHRINFPEAIVIEEDITTIAKNPVKHICEANGIGRGDIAGVIGGPPCQGFSYMGERFTGDERNLLTSRFMDVVMALEPEFFVMENVAGLLTSGNVPKFGTYITRLGKSIGEPATRIVERLPSVKICLAKRDKQFRKRTISKAITSFREKLFGEVRAGISLHDGVGFLSTTFADLRQWLISETCEAYQLTKERSDEQKAISEAILHHPNDIAEIALGLMADILIERKLLSEQNVEEYVKSLAKKSNMPKAVVDTVKRIVHEYDSSPKSEVYKGVSVGPILAHLIQRASKMYDVAAPKVLNAAWYGTPQSRQRLFLVGINRKRRTSFTFPQQLFTLPAVEPASDIFASGNDLLKSLFPVAPNVFEAIGDLPDIDDFEELRDGDKIAAHNMSNAPSEYAAFMRLERIDSNDFTLPRITWNPYALDCSNRTIHTEEVINRLKQTLQGEQEETSHKSRLDSKKVSHTLRAGTREGKGSHTAVRPVHYRYHRVISVREGARIMGYPDWMMFHHTKWHGFRLVGNGVPFHLGSAIAKGIYSLLSFDECSTDNGA